MQGKATHYVVMTQAAGAPSKEVGVYTGRDKAKREADLAHYREPEKDWWVEARTVIWHHEGDPQP